MAAAVRAIRVRKRKERQRAGARRPQTSPLAQGEAAENELAEDSKADKRVFPYVEGVGRISGHWGRVLPLQVQVCKLYNTPHVTWFIAAVILANFFAIIVEKEFDPYTVQRFPGVWVAIDDISNSIFLAELLVNYYGSGYRRFWSSGWNIFDFFVVFVGVLTLSRIPLGSFSQLKMLRTFRVFRLFKRIKSLNKIIVALLNAIPGVLNAFIIMLIFMAIYAILAVDYFRSFGGSYGPLPGGTGKLCMHGELEHASNGHGCSSFQTTVAIEFPEFVNGSYANQSHSALSQRGYVIGDEYYGTFSRALFTLFQVLTGDAWAEVVVRPLLFGYNSAGALSATFVGLFFASYLLLMQIVLINVVVAVLLDKFVADEPSKSADDQGSASHGDAQAAAEEGTHAGKSRAEARCKRTDRASSAAAACAGSSSAALACDAAFWQAQNGAASAGALAPADVPSISRSGSPGSQPGRPSDGAGRGGAGHPSSSSSEAGPSHGGLLQLQGDVTALGQKVDKLSADMEQVLAVLRKTYEEPRPLPDSAGWWSGSFQA